MKKFYLPQKRCVTSDNSHYSIVKDLLLQLSTKRRNFSIQNGLVPFEGSSFIANLRSNLKFQIAKPGGGEGIRTPDPRVANAVLCQLSYTPDKQS